MENKKLRKLFIMPVIVYSLVLLGILCSYAFFLTTTGSNKNELINAQTGTLSLTFADGNDAIIESLEFGGSVEKTFTIENTGSLDAIARIMWDDLINTYTLGSLTYVLSFSDSEDGVYEELVSNNVPRSDVSTEEILIDSLNIPIGTKYFYKLTITLNNLESTDQASDVGAILSTHFKISEGTPKYIITFMNEDDVLETREVSKNENYGGLPTPTKEGYVFMGWFTEENGGGERITEESMVNLNSNKIFYAKWEQKLDAKAILNKVGKSVKSGNPTFKNSATTDETSTGLYSLKDDYGTSYYYRGNVVDNYVKFANFYWRIIRINGDGSVRLLYDGTKAHANNDSDKERVVSSFVPWNTTNYDDAKYVGYMYGGKNGTASTKRIGLGEAGYEDSLNAIYNETNSNVKTVLESWYNKNLTDYDDYIADEIFCNDRSFESRNTGTGIGSKTTQFGARGRTGVSSGPVAPQFTCPNKNDAFTKNDKEKGNGKLNEKVGLITVDEAIAGGTGSYNSVTNKNNYLYRTEAYWTGTPAVFTSAKGAQMFYLGAGKLNFNNVEINNMFMIAPVISLTPEYFNNLTGDGSMTDPFREIGMEP